MGSLSKLVIASLQRKKNQLVSLLLHNAYAPVSIWASVLLSKIKVLTEQFMN